MHVYVITNPASGWDCVCGVVKAKNFSNEQEALQWWLESMDISLDYQDDYIAHYEAVEG